MVFRVRILFPDRPDKFPDLLPVFISLCLHCAADICCKCTASFKSALHIFGTQASGQKKWSGKPWNERQVKSFSASSVLSLCIGVKEQILAGQLLRFQDLLPALYADCFYHRFLSKCFQTADIGFILISVKLNDIYDPLFSDPCCLPDRSVYKYACRQNPIRQSCP